MEKILLLTAANFRGDYLSYQITVRALASDGTELAKGIKARELAAQPAKWEVPDPPCWRALKLRCQYARHEFPGGLAAEVASRDSPAVRIEIGDDAVYFH